MAEHLGGSLTRAGPFSLMGIPACQVGHRKPGEPAPGDNKKPAGLPGGPERATLSSAGSPHLLAGPEVFRAPPGHLFGWRARKARFSTLRGGAPWHNGENPGRLSKGKRQVPSVGTMVRQTHAEEVSLDPVLPAVGSLEVYAERGRAGAPRAVAPTRVPQGAFRSSRADALGRRLRCASARRASGTRCGGGTRPSAGAGRATRRSPRCADRRRGAAAPGPPAR